MQVIFKVFGTLTTAMTVVNTEDLELWPLLIGDTWHFICRLDHVEDYGNSVFVRLPDDSDIRISCECFH